jgi:hypothetical protein
MIYCNVFANVGFVESITSNLAGILQMFIIRTLFWVSLVVLLLPIGKDNNSNIIGATKYAVEGSDKFCTRNVDICNISAEVWSSLKYKAAYGVEMVSGVAREIRENSRDPYDPAYRSRKNEWSTGNVEKNASAKKVQFKGQNTLRSSDLEPSWSLEEKHASL